MSGIRRHWSKAIKVPRSSGSAGEQHEHMANLEVKIMIITRSTTVKEIMQANPEVAQVFLKHGVDVPLECDESIQDCELELCDSMCHIDDVDALIRDLQKFFQESGEAQ